MNGIRKVGSHISSNGGNRNSAPSYLSICPAEFYQPKPTTHLQQECINSNVY